MAVLARLHLRQVRRHGAVEALRGRQHHLLSHHCSLSCCRSRVDLLKPHWLLNGRRVVSALRVLTPAGRHGLSLQGIRLRLHLLSDSGGLRRLGGGVGGRGDGHAGDRGRGSGGGSHGRESLLGGVHDWLSDGSALLVLLS